MQSPSPRPEHWVDHPQIPITRRAVLGGIAILLIGIVVALASVYARRTRLEKTTAFWGSDTIRALQLSPQVLLTLDKKIDDKRGQESFSAASPAQPAGPMVADLTGTPGLGHLRRALLDERHYDWSTRTPESVESLRADDTEFARLEFSDPRGYFPTATIHLELTAGWAGLAGRADRVRFTPRVQPAVRHFLKTVSNAQQAHYDQRQSDEE